MKITPIFAITMKSLTRNTVNITNATKDAKGDVMFSE
jgi:hypothetical protein